MIDAHVSGEQLHTPKFDELRQELDEMRSDLAKVKGIHELKNLLHLCVIIRDEAVDERNELHGMSVEESRFIFLQAEHLVFDAIRQHPLDLLPDVAEFPRLANGRVDEDELRSIRQKFPFAFHTTTKPHIYKAQLDELGKVVGGKAVAEANRIARHELGHYSRLIAQPRASTHATTDAQFSMLFFRRGSDPSYLPFVRYDAGRLLPKDILEIANEKGDLSRGDRQELWELRTEQAMLFLQSLFSRRRR